jgi:iron complex transport system ATP-binding protein
MNSVITATDLTVGYGEKAIVKNINFSVSGGEILCLIGANGSGKSTILRTLSGMLPVIKGNVYAGERNIKKIPPAELATYMSVVFTDRLKLQMMSAFDVVAMGRSPYTSFFGKLTSQDIDKVNECLQEVDAIELSEYDYMSLSDGQKQKILIARALAQEPNLIILDEPTSHLDIKHKIEIMQILVKLAEKKVTVILSLHDVDLAIGNCHRAMLIKQGEIISIGKPTDVISGNSIQSLFNMSDIQFDRLTNTLDNYVKKLQYKS